MQLQVIIQFLFFFWPKLYSDAVSFDDHLTLLRLFLPGAPFSAAHGPPPRPQAPTLAAALVLGTNSIKYFIVAK